MKAHATFAVAASPTVITMPELASTIEESLRGIYTISPLGLSARSSVPLSYVKCDESPQLAFTKGSKESVTQCGKTAKESESGTAHYQRVRIAEG